MPSHRVTLKDIAAECGVSVMTVSRVMRKQRYVKAEIREKVEAVAERLDYRPDPALAALIRHRRKASGGAVGGEMLAMIVPEEARFGWGRFPILTELEGDMAAEASKLGYKLKLFSIPTHGASLEPTLRKLYNRGIRGLMLAPSIDISCVPEKLWTEFVVVTLEAGAHKVPFHAIRNDYFQMCECAVEALHNKGLRRIGYVAGPMDGYNHFRAVGTLVACRERFFKLEADYFRVPTWEPPIPKAYLNWVRDFRPQALISISTHIRHWHDDWPAKNKPNIEFVQLNRPRWDPSIHGVCTPSGVHGTAIIQRLHQLLLDDERGIPKARTVLRIDGYWRSEGE